MSDNRPDSDIHVFERSPDDIRRYARRRYVLFGLHLAVGIGFLVAMLAGTSAHLADWARLIAPPGSFLWTVFFYFAGFSITYFVVSLPLTFYGEYLLEHQFGLSNQTLGRWAVRRLKKWTFSFIIATPIVLLFYVMLRQWPARWWLPASIAWVLVSYVFTRFAPRLVIPLFYKLTPIGDEVLASRLTALAANAGIRVLGVFHINLSVETKKANAAVVGLGSSRRVVLGDTLLERFTHDEIATVFAHELGHVVHGDMAKGFALASVLTLGSLFAGSVVLIRAAAALGIPNVYDPAALPILLAVIAAINLLILPLEKWYSRVRERQSDAYALRTTRDRKAFISAMKKLGAINLADVSPNRIAEIFLFSHPPIIRRIRFALHFPLDPEP